MLQAIEKPFSAYRLLTGPDDASFCHKVTKALAEGWSLHGNPSITFDAATGRVICAQAVVKDVPRGRYDPDLKLGEL